MGEKKISEMTSDEILRQQLELLAEKSKKTKSVKKLVELTSAIKCIAEVYASY